MHSLVGRTWTIYQSISMCIRGTFMIQLFALAKKLADFPKIFRSKKFFFLQYLYQTFWIHFPSSYTKPSSTTFPLNLLILIELLFDERMECFLIDKIEILVFVRFPMNFYVNSFPLIRKFITINTSILKNQKRNDKK